MFFQVENYFLFQKRKLKDRSRDGVKQINCVFFWMESNLGRYNKLVQLYMGEEQEINSSNPFHITIYRKHGEEIPEKKGEIDWFNS